MSRRAIIFTAKGPAAFRNVEKDSTGRPLVLLEEDEKVTVKLDFQSFVETGETISTVAITGNNITATNAVAADNLSTTLTLSGAKDFGDVKVVVTFSSGEIWRDKIIVRNKRRYTVPQSTTDYGEPRDC